MKNAATIAAEAAHAALCTNGCKGHDVTTKCGTCGGTGMASRHATCRRCQGGRKVTKTIVLKGK